MTWTKLDSDAVRPDQPLSAFVGKRLVDNANTYNKELTRFTSFAYPLTSAGAAQVKWASVFGRRGTVVTVDVGPLSDVFIFRLVYKTTNADIGGVIHIRDLDRGYIVSKGVPPSATLTMLEVPYVTGGVSGIRGFHIGFESDVGTEALGTVEVFGAVANQVFCGPFGSPAQYPFTTAAGSFTEMYHLMSLDAGSGNPAPSGNSLLDYQVCGFKHNTSPNQPPDGVLVVWPNVEVNPPLTTTNTTGSAKINATVYELGRLELFSISVEMQWNLDNNLVPPFVYQQPTPINRLNNYINGAMPVLQPNAATMLSTDGFLGCVLPAGEEATFAFFVQTVDTVLTLNVSFRAVAYNQADNAPNITFGVRDWKGDTVGTDVLQEDVPVPRVTGQSTVEPREGTATYMNGVLAGNAQWGMRDAMPVEDAQTGMPLRFVWGPNLPGDFTQATKESTETVYYGTITATADLYIYAFNCKVL